MKAITYYEYGSPDNFKLEEVDIPEPKPKEVRIKVFATSINSWDWDLLKGAPNYVRLVGGGLRKPIKKILGCDVAGIVDAVGSEVKNMKVGNEVFGDISQYGWGGFAEYVCAKETAFHPKPALIPFEEAAAIPQAGVMALQGIRDFRNLKEGDRVLINGAGGGVGTFAIQLAKLYGAEITGVDRTSKFDTMRSLGASRVIDFMQEDVTKRQEQYDLIIDVVGFHSLSEYKKILNQGGNYRLVGGSASVILQSMLIAPFISIFTSKKMGILAHEPNKYLEQLLGHFKNDDVKPVIDKVFSLEDTAKAFAYYGTGEAVGKVVVSVAN